MIALDTDLGSLILAADPHQKLVGVHPDLVVKVQMIVIALAAIGSPLIVTAGVRSVAEQQALYAQGRTTAGPIVTEDDGIVHKSNHQPHDDGFGHAVDCAFLVDGQPSWDAHLPWMLYGMIAERLGLHWGGRWTTPHDLPHVELP